MVEASGAPDLAADETAEGEGSVLSPTARRLRSRLHKRRDAELRPRTKASRLLLFTFLALPVSWLLGLHELAWPVLVLPIAGFLVRRGRIYAPRALLLWLLYVAIALVAAVSAGIGYFTVVMYLAATVLFLFGFNASIDELPDHVVVSVMALFWVTMVVGGLISIATGVTEFPSLGATIFQPEPGSWLEGVTKVQFADPLKEGYTEGLFGSWDSRPKGFLTWSNHWGSAFVMLLPASLLLRFQMERGRLRNLLDITIVLSVVPFVLARNRWAWLSLVVVVVYGIVRFWRPRPYLARSLLGLLVASAVIIASTPLVTVVIDRLEFEGSEGSRSEQYQQSFDLIDESPWLGFGVSQVSTDPDWEGLELGIDSQILQTMVLHGVVALAVFLAWMLLILHATRAMDTPLLVLAHVGAFVLLFHSMYYVFLPHRLMFLMLLAGSAYRYRYLVVEPRTKRGRVLVDRRAKSGLILVWSADWLRRSRVRNARRADGR